MQHPHSHANAGLFAAALWIGIAAAPPPVQAGQALVVVAANFTGAAREIGELFRQSTGHEAVFSFGSTGKFYTQITQDAPFEVFLAADQKRPQLAVSEGFAVPRSRFTYATGKLVLFSPDRRLVTGPETLQAGAFNRIAIANPATAPYGNAAVHAMRELGVYAALAPRIVRGNNIAQAFQFVATGNAELGFVALSQLAHDRQGSRWIVPGHLYPSLAQDAVLLKRGQGNAAAEAFMTFLKGPQAAAIKSKYGYGVGD